MQRGKCKIYRRTFLCVKTDWSGHVYEYRNYYNVHWGPNPISTRRAWPSEYEVTHFLSWVCPDESLLSAEPLHTSPSAAHSSRMLFALQPGPPSYYPFRFFDDVTKKWTRARYVAELHVIAERYSQWEIIGPPEIRKDVGGSFNPFRRPAAHLPPVEEPPPDHGPTPDPPPVEQPPPIEDQLERFFVLLFLRRYVTYCASCRRFAAMNGAAKLFAEVGREQSR
jgi:hypothetical protein